MLIFELIPRGLNQILGHPAIEKHFDISDPLHGYMYLRRWYHRQQMIFSPCSPPRDTFVTLMYLDGVTCLSSNVRVDRMTFLRQGVRNNVEGGCTIVKRARALFSGMVVNSAEDIPHWSADILDLWCCPSSPLAEDLCNFGHGLNA